ncbi:MAG: hypothetical protein EOO89_27510 [Pedobacter sp.]|nr:MAG: hypothetical protein EOO89_27510 [Pedobacter sp.]
MGPEADEFGCNPPKIGQLKRRKFVIIIFKGITVLLIIANRNTKSNPLNQQYGASSSLYLASNIYAGISYTPSVKVIVSSTIIRAGRNMNVVVGINYDVINNFSLRGGINTFPFGQYGGIGYTLKNLAINMAFSRDLNLGYVPQIDLGYAF